ncbi:hypothetical protein KCP77_14540 [Salmonella enterica subsp. enterica]|nr:hypothetical protein KCP77_14540 [Salmonella enterica subsp. enterica]
MKWRARGQTLRTILCLVYPAFAHKAARERKALSRALAASCIGASTRYLYKSRRPDIISTQQATAL